MVVMHASLVQILLVIVILVVATMMRVIVVMMMSVTRLCFGLSLNRWMALGPHNVNIELCG
jgi:hypothetical protein